MVSATGEIKAKEFVDIQTEVAGVIIDLLVQEGDEVQQGQVLLKLDALQLQAEVDSAKAQLGAAEADARSSEVGVATAEANFAAEETALANAKVEAGQSQTSEERARSSFQRKQAMFDAGLIGREEFEISKAEARLAEQRLDFAARISWQRRTRGRRSRASTPPRGARRLEPAYDAHARRKRARPIWREDGHPRCSVDHGIGEEARRDPVQLGRT